MLVKRVDEYQLDSYRKHLIQEEKSNITIEKYIRDVRMFFYILITKK